MVCTGFPLCWDEGWCQPCFFPLSVQKDSWAQCVLLQVERTLKHSWWCCKNIHNKDQTSWDAFKHLKDSCYLFKKTSGIWQGFRSLLGSSCYTNMMFLGTSAALPKLWPEVSHPCKCGVGDGCPRIICAFPEETKTFNSLFIFISIHMLSLAGNA